MSGTRHSAHTSFQATLDRLPVETSELADLAAMFATSLRAARRSPRTIQGYLEAIKLLCDYLVEQGMPTDPLTLSREHIESFFADLAARPAKRSGLPMTGKTVFNRYRSLHAFFEYLVRVDELPRSPMDKMLPPKRPKRPPPVLPLDQIRALLSACDGRDFDSRRDKAIIALMLDTGLRREEVAGIALADIDWNNQTVTVLGKGEKQRKVGFGDQTALTLRAYIRMRRLHPAHELAELWLGKQGMLTYWGIYQAIKRRARAAGIEGVWLHLFRHSWAHYFREAGGSETDLKTAGGWDSDEMVRWYGSSEAEGRATRAGREHSPVDMMMREKRKK